MKTARCLMLQRPQPIEETRAWLDMATSHSPQNADIWALYGLSEISNGQLDNAAKHFREAIALEPETWHFWNALAVAESLMLERTSRDDEDASLALLAHHYATAVDHARDNETAVSLIRTNERIFADSDMTAQYRVELP